MAWPDPPIGAAGTCVRPKAGDTGVPAMPADGVPVTDAASPARDGRGSVGRRVQATAPRIAGFRSRTGAGPAGVRSRTGAGLPGFPITGSAIAGYAGGPVTVLRGPGGDRLSRVLRHSTIGAEAFDGRVRDGIGSCHLAWATRPAKNSDQ